MMCSAGMSPSEVRTLIDVLDTDNDGDMAAWDFNFLQEEDGVFFSLPTGVLPFKISGGELELCQIKT